MLSHPVRLNKAGTGTLTPSPGQHHRKLARERKTPVKKEGGYRRPTFSGFFTLNPLFGVYFYNLIILCLFALSRSAIFTFFTTHTDAIPRRRCFSGMFSGKEDSSPGLVLQPRKETNLYVAQALSQAIFRPARPFRYAAGLKNDFFYKLILFSK